MARGDIPPADWNKARLHISRNFRYRLSPHTLIELLVGIHRCAKAYFETDQRPLRILADQSQDPVFLHFGGPFISRTLFQNRLPSPSFEPKDLRQWLLVSLAARTKKELLEGVEMVPGSGVLYSMDLTKVEDDLQKGKVGHATRLQRARARELPVPSRVEWGYKIHNLEVSNDEESLCIAHAFDAAYVLDTCFYGLAATNEYDFKDTDYLDLNQLFYLCDPRVHMVTMERKLPQRIARSTQRDRVFRFAELLKHAGDAIG